MKKTKRHRRKEWVIAVIVVTAVFILMWMIRPWKREAPKVAEVPETPKVRRAFDGVLVEQGKEQLPIVGVMVENMVEAQPISGIAEAALVFEALTEANITRLLAYFVLPSPPPQSSPLKGEEEERNFPPLVGGVRGGGAVVEVGPVRSARPYFLDFAAEFDTLFAHVGSSPAAFELLRKKGVEGVHDLDQWYNSEYFFVKNGRAKPHHLYTSVELLREAYSEIFPERSVAKSKGIAGSPSTSSGTTLGDVESWKFKSDAPPDLRGNVQDIQIGYVAPYDVQWLYDKSANHYQRMQWGGVHKDANSKEIIAKNIAVAFQLMEVLDEIGRKKFTTIGEGKGLVFQDGRVVVGKWKKPSAQERMRFYDAQGTEVELNAGVTWVEIVPEGREVTY